MSSLITPTSGLTQLAIATTNSGSPIIALPFDFQGYRALLVKGLFNTLFDAGSNEDNVYLEAAPTPTSIQGANITTKGAVSASNISTSNIPLGNVYATPDLGNFSRMSVLTMYLYIQDALTNHIYFDWTLSSGNAADSAFSASQGRGCIVYSTEPTAIQIKNNRGRNWCSAGELVMFGISKLPISL